MRGVQLAAIRSAPILEQLNTAVVRILDAASRLLSGLPGGPVTDLLAGALLLVRRGLFDQAPVVRSTQQLTSALQTEGLVIANDPEGDPVEIELAAAPKFGTVTLTADGSYLYTPGAGYAGADSFTVRATDTNGGFNLFFPASDGATLHTVAITGPAPATVLTVNLRAAFLQEVTGTETGQAGSGTLHGSYVYLYQPQPAEGASNWTKLIDNGQITAAVKAPDAQHPDYFVNVALNAQGQQISGGAAYLIVQSQNPVACQTGQTSGCHTDLTQVADWQEAFVQQKVQAYNFGYTAFEYALLGQAGDQGDITYIPGFGPHVAVKVCATPSSCDTRGLAQNSTDFIAGLLNAGVSQDAVFTYPSAPESSTPYSPLDGKPSIVISPSNGTFGASYYPETNWNDYLTKTIDKVPPNAMTFSGTTSGARDAAGIWHNGQYYSYSVQAVTDSSANGYYLFSPDANSQTQGYMLIKQTDVGKNLYAPGQGSALAALYDSVSVSDGVITALGTPYDIPGRTPPGTTAPGPGQFNVSANNQWGNALTQYFTGFTAGNWGAVADQANPVNQGGPSAANLAGPVDLNTNLNWDPAYAFDSNRVPGTAPAYQHNDQYSFYFYENANTYASAFSDNLAQKLNPGPQISLATGPGINQNVSQIDLYV
ncbi:MAG: Ig-like domain-containing protein, partial [Mycobacterium sp.]